MWLYVDLDANHPADTSLLLYTGAAKTYLVTWMAVVYKGHDEAG